MEEGYFHRGKNVSVTNTGSLKIVMLRAYWPLASLLVLEGVLVFAHGFEREGGTTDWSGYLDPGQGDGMLGGL